MRVLTYWVYRANAYRVFPDLRLRLRSFSRVRLKEVTSFSVYMLLIDSATKLNYALDALVVGAFLNTGAVALWSVSQRLAETTQRLTNQLNDVLFPNVVDNDTASRLDRLQRIFLVGTRFSLATVVPLAGTLMLLAHPLLRAWVGDSFTEGELRQGAVVLQVLALAVLVRIGSATSGTVLKGAGRHRLVALCNVATAAANLSLSVVLIGPFGLAGVALGTPLPVSLGAMLVLFPAGCRRVELSLGRALAEAVWPAIWPGAVMAAVGLADPSALGGVAAGRRGRGVVAIMVYAITFLRFGVSPAERRFCVSQASTLIGRPRLVRRRRRGHEGAHSWPGERSGRSTSDCGPEDYWRACATCGRHSRQRGEVRRPRAGRRRPTGGGLPFSENRPPCMNASSICASGRSR